MGHWTQLLQWAADSPSLQLLQNHFTFPRGAFLLLCLLKSLSNISNRYIFPSIIIILLTLHCTRRHTVQFARANPQKSLFTTFFWPCTCVTFMWWRLLGMQQLGPSYMLTLGSKLLFHTRNFLGGKGWGSGSRSVAMRDRAALYSLWLLSV